MGTFRWEISNKSEIERKFKKLEDEMDKVTAEMTNATALFVANNANKLTAKSSASKIRSDMNKSTMVGGTMGEVMVNSRRKTLNLPRLKGMELRSAVEHVIQAKIASITYLKSGWLPAINKLIDRIKLSNGYSFVKRYAPLRDPKSKQKGKPKGGVIYATPNRGLKTATIWNSAGQVKGDINSARTVLTEGLVKAITKTNMMLRNYYTLRLEKYIKDNV